MRENPYQSPAPCEPTPTQQMRELQMEFERRYAQLFGDMFMAARFSAVLGLIAWNGTQETAYTVAAVVAPALVIGGDAVYDLFKKSATYPARMHQMRQRVASEWRATGGYGDQA